MNNSSQSNLWVIGQGAIGCTLGAFAQAHSSKVKFVSRSKVGAIEVQHLNGDKSQLPIPMSWTELEQHPPVIEKALVTVKAPQVNDAITALLPFLPNSKAHIILCHNGMGTIEDVLPKLKNHFVYFCTTSLGALKEGNVVKETGEGVSQWALIHYPQTHICGHTSALAQKDMVRLIPYASATDDINKILWRKLAVNSVINPITAIRDIDNGDVLKPQFRPQTHLIIKELIAVASTQNVLLCFESLVTLVEEVAQRTAKNRSSMRQDINAGQMTEIDFINGYIAKLGRQHGIATPANDEMVASIYKLQSEKK